MIKTLTSEHLFDQMLKRLSRRNANTCIFGDAGSGKSFLLQSLAMQFSKKAIQSFIVAPMTGCEFKRACDFVGGTFVRICPGSSNCINVLDIRVPNRSFNEAIEGEAALREDSLLAKKIQDLKIAFLLLIPEMTNVQEQLFDMALVKTYGRFHITLDNRSLFRDDDPSRLKDMPTLGDLYNTMLEEPRLEEAATVINVLVSGSASNFNGHTNVDLNNSYIVFDISDLAGKILPFGMMVVLDFIMSKVKEDRTVKKALFLDEICPLIDSDSNNYAAEFVLKLFKTICGYGGAAIAATISINDFFALENGKYGSAILSSSEIKIIKHLEPYGANTMQKVLNLNDNEIQVIRQFDHTQGLFCLDNFHGIVQFMATDVERALLSTDMEEIKRLMTKKD